MSYIESHQELGRHPKTKRFARLLGVSLPCAVGHLHFLWWWAMDYAQDGDISRFDAFDLADAAAYEGDPEQFLAALVECGVGNGAGFIERHEDGVLLLHDWADYGGKLFEERRRNAQKQARYRDQKAGNPMIESHARNVTVTSRVTLKERREEKRREEMPSASLARTHESDDDEIRPVPENRTTAQETGEGTPTQAPADLPEVPLGFRAADSEVPLGFRSPDPEPDAAFLDSLGEVAPLPAAPTRREQQRADAKRRLEILALIQAFGEVRYSRAPDAQVTTAEFEKVGSLFAQLWEIGVTPAQVKRVVAYAMKTWPDPKTVQPRTVVERWSGLLADSTTREPAARPVSPSRPLALPRAGGGVKQEAPAWRPGMLRTATSIGGIIPPMPQADGTISSPMIAQDPSPVAKDPAEGAAV